MVCDEQAGACSGARRKRCDASHARTNREERRRHRVREMRKLSVELGAELVVSLVDSSSHCPISLAIKLISPRTLQQHPLILCVLHFHLPAFTALRSTSQLLCCVLKVCFHNVVQLANVVHRLSLLHTRITRPGQSWLQRADTKASRTACLAQLKRLTKEWSVGVGSSCLIPLACPRRG